MLAAGLPRWPVPHAITDKPIVITAIISFILLMTVRPHPYNYYQAGVTLTVSSDTERSRSSVYASDVRRKLISILDVSLLFPAPLRTVFYGKLGLQTEDNSLNENL